MKPNVEQLNQLFLQGKVLEFMSANPKEGVDNVGLVGGKDCSATMSLFYALFPTTDYKGRWIYIGDVGKEAHFKNPQEYITAVEFLDLPQNVLDMHIPSDPHEQALSIRWSSINFSPLVLISMGKNNETQEDIVWMHFAVGFSPEEALAMFKETLTKQLKQQRTA